MSRKRQVSVASLFIIVVLCFASFAPTVAAEAPTPGPRISLKEYDLFSESGPSSITVGPDGALWFTEINMHKIGRITVSGKIAEFAVQNEPVAISAGPDGALWFTESGKIGRITTAGAITEYDMPTADSNPGAITTGPDGALWFTEMYSTKIGRITTAGVITEYDVSTAIYYTGGITTGPDGALWFTEEHKIGRITTAGMITEYRVPTMWSTPQGITTGSDGALWFTESGKIGRITTAGVASEYRVPTKYSNYLNPQGITAGPDGALWFTGLGGMGRITTTGAVTGYGLDADQSPGITTGPDGALWLTESHHVRNPRSDSWSRIGRAQPVMGSVYYFAEGTTRPNFDTYFCIQNPGGDAAIVDITYMEGDGNTESQTVAVAGHSRATVSARDKLGTGDDAAHDFSSVVRCADKQIVVERPMYFNYHGKWTGGSDVMGANNPASTFYFAEGTTRPNFDTYLCIQNPGDEAADVKIRYYKAGGNYAAEHQVSQVLRISKHSRATVSPKDILGRGDDANHDFSSTVECTNGQKIVAERPMYFNCNGWTGGSDIMGATTASDKWYLAEGSTRASDKGTFKEWLCILNLGNDSDVHITLILENGATIEKTYDHWPTGRLTVDVNAEVGTGHDVSAVVTSGSSYVEPWGRLYNPIIVERAMYFDYKSGWTGGSAATGAQPAGIFYFAEGSCRPEFDTYLCIQNPGDTNANVKITYLKGDGTTGSQTLTVAKKSRTTVSARDTVGTGEDAAHDFSSIVKCTNDQQIVVERPMYFNYQGKWTGGHDVGGFVPGVINH